MQSLAVFCSSSEELDPYFYQVASQLGKAMAQQGIKLVYGGSDIGLMGTVSRSIQQHGGKTLGISPESLNIEGVVSNIDDELIITESMSQRKSTMIDHADGFIGLPGGFGTLEEMFEVLTLKQLGEHNKPIVFLNVKGFYDKLLDMFEHMYAQKCAKPEYRQLYQLCDDVPSVLDYLINYCPPKLPEHWFL